MGGLLGQVLVLEAELAGDSTALAGERRIDDAVLLGEGGQHHDRVVADREEDVAGLVRPAQATLQLSELRLAVRLRPGAPVEDDQRLLAGARPMQIDGAPVLVA